MQHEVFIALGTNLGSRLENLRAAREHLRDVLAIEDESSVYETEPWGYAAQPAFLNQVVRGRARLSAPALLKALKAIEAHMGREETFRYGPRLIDLDLLFYDDLVLQTQELNVPHPQLHERNFVLVPLEEIAPEWEHPLSGKMAAQMAAEVDRQGVVVYADEGQTYSQAAGGAKMSDENLKPLSGGQSPKWASPSNGGPTAG